MRCSINITVHNKAHLLPEFLHHFLFNTPGIHNRRLQQDEVIFVFDGCTDDSQQIVEDWHQRHPGLNVKILTAPNVFETKANNLAARASSGEYIAILQDDVIIKEYDWTERLILPMVFWADVFAVTGNTAHNWELNPNSQDIHTTAVRTDRWCDILNHTCHANSRTSSRDIFAVRQCVNRAPLMLRHSALKQLGYFDEAFSPQDMDDHDLCMRARKELGMVCGCLPVEWFSRPEWGGTRDEHGTTKPWLFGAHHKNTRLFYERHKDMIGKGAEIMHDRLMHGNIKKY